MNNSGQIIKSKSTERFTAIPNDIIKSKDLSLTEKGLLIYLLSLPGDWILYKSQLHKELSEKKNLIDRTFKRLQDIGYIESHKTLDGAGRFTGWCHTVYDVPVVKTQVADYHPTSSFSDIGETPKSDFTDVGESRSIQKTENTDKRLINTEKEKNILKKEKSLPDPDDPIQVRFEEFRSNYKGTRLGFDIEFENFTKKNKPISVELIDEMICAVEKEKSYHEWLVKKGELAPQWKHLSTWINKKCWTQEFPPEYENRNIPTTKEKKPWSPKE